MLRLSSWSIPADVRMLDGDRRLVFFFFFFFFFFLNFLDVRRFRSVRASSFLDDPYPHFAHHVRHQPVFYAEDLGYWVVSRYDDCRRALREFTTFSASNALAPVTVPCPAGADRARRRRVPLDPDDHQRRPAGAHPDPPHRPGRVHAAARRRDGRRRAPAGARVPRPAPPRRSFRHRRRAHLGAPGARPVPRPRRPASDITEVKEGAKNRLRFMFGRAGDDEQVSIAAGMARFWRYCEELADDRAPGRATTSRPTSCTRPTRAVSR